MIIIDHNEEYNTPWVTSVVIALYFIGLVACYAWRDHVDLTVLDRSTFLAVCQMVLRTDIIGFVINGYLLWVFGDNVEYILGHGRYTLFLIISAFATGFLHLFLSPLADSVIEPGLYGAIGCVIGAYARIFPRVHIDILYTSARSRIKRFFNHDDWWDMFEINAQWVAIWWVIIGACCLFAYQAPNVMVKIVPLQAAGIVIGWVVGSLWRDDAVILQGETNMSFKRDHWRYLQRKSTDPTDGTPTSDMFEH